MGARRETHIGMFPSHEAAPPKNPAADRSPRCRHAAGGRVLHTTGITNTGPPDGIAVVNKAGALAEDARPPKKARGAGAERGGSFYVDDFGARSWPRPPSR
jgi:hypothetical protein